MRTKKGEYSEMLWVNGVRGRGRLSVAVGPREYWAFTSEPTRDVPRRNKAIAEAGGDTWKAIHNLAQFEAIETETDSSRRR